MLITTDIISTVLHLMANGSTPTEVAAKLGMSKKTLARHVKTNEALQEAYELGLTQFEASLEGIGRDLMLGKIQGKDNVWKMFMHRYGEGWADKTEIKDTTSNINDLSDEELQSRIKSLTTEKNSDNA